MTIRSSFETFAARSTVRLHSDWYGGAIPAIQLTAPLLSPVAERCVAAFRPPSFSRTSTYQCRIVP